MPVFLNPAKAYEESKLYFDPPNDRAFRLAESELAETLFARFGVQEDPLGMDALQGRVRNKMRGRIELLHVTPATTLFLMNHRAAASHGLPIKSSDDLLGVPAPSRARRR